MSISPIQSGYTPAQTKFGGSQQAYDYRPYNAPYGTTGYYRLDPVSEPKPQGAGTFTKLLVTGLVIGGSVFAFKKISPEYYSKALSLAETVTPDFIKSGYANLANLAQKHTPDFIKNGYADIAAKAKNLFPGKAIEQAAQSGYAEKAKNAVSAVITAPVKLFNYLFSRGG